MNSKLKTLGLALLAMFAISAVAASGASALEAEIEGEGEAYVTSEQIEAAEHKDHTFTNFFGEITCKKAKFDGVGAVKNGATLLTVTPTYSECEVSGKPTTISHNECTYVFHGGTKVNGDHFKEIQVDLECPEKQTGVEINVYKSVTTHANNERLCTFVVHPFTNKVGNTVENTTTAEPKKDIDITTTVTGIATKRTFGTFLNCGPENTNNTYTGASTLTAFSDEGHTTPIGIGLK